MSDSTATEAVPLKHRIGDVVHFLDAGEIHRPATIVQLAKDESATLIVKRPGYDWHVTNSPRDETRRKVGSWHTADEQTPVATPEAPGTAPASLAPVTQAESHIPAVGQANALDAVVDPKAAASA